MKDLFQNKDIEFCRVIGAFVTQIYCGMYAPSPAISKALSSLTKDGYVREYNCIEGRKPVDLDISNHSEMLAVFTIRTWEGTNTKQAINSWWRILNDELKGHHDYDLIVRDIKDAVDQFMLGYRIPCRFWTEPDYIDFFEAL